MSWAEDNYLDCLETIEDDEFPIAARMQFFKVAKETEKAYLLQLGESVFSEKIWIPKSQIYEMDEEAGEVLLKTWLAAQNGWDYEEVEL